MEIDPRLNEIDDCLYRVAVKVIVTHENKILLVKEIPELWWSFPGGGIEHGEPIKAALVRELEEELGVSPSDITTDYKIIHHTIGTVVNGIPRMNVFYKVNISPQALSKTAHVEEWQWFTRDEFMDLNMGPSFKNRGEIAAVIFGK